MTAHLDRSGQQFGNYRLECLLGRGGFAEVYLGTHLRLKRQAAIKVLHTHLGEHDLQAFQREAELIAALDHPHIVRVFDFDVQEGLPFLVMDYLPGGTLRKRHPRGARVPLATVLSYVRPMADALSYAHTQRFIHRDVKPENLLVGARDEIVLSDFGIAAIAHSTSSRTEQDVAGTAAYMAPEQIHAQACTASDQYALAIIVYEWLTGERPFHGSLSELLAKHLMTPPPSLCEKLPSLPTAVEQVVLRALAKSPADRFPDIGTFASALSAAVEPPLLGTFPTDEETIVSPRPPMPYIPPLAPTLSASPPPTQRAPRTQPVQPSPGAGSGETALPHVSPPTPPFQASSLQIGAAHGSPVFPPSAPTSAHTPPLWTSPDTMPPVQKPASTFQASLPPIRARQNGAPPPLVQQTWPRKQTPSPHASARSLSRRMMLIGLVAGSGGLMWWLLTPRSPGQASLSLSPTKQPSPAKKVVSPSPTKQPTPAPPPFTYRGHSGGINTVAWSPSGKRIASASDMVHVWDAADGGHVFTYRKHSQGIWAVGWSPDGKRIASASEDGTVHVWNATDGSNVFIYRGHAGPVYTIAWLPHGNRIASGSSDNTVHVWDATTGGNVFIYRKHSSTVRSVSWEPSGKRIASGSWDNTVHLWNATDGGNSFIYQAHYDPVFAVAWSPDSKLVASGGSMGGSLYVWHAATGDDIYAYEGHAGRGGVIAVAWSLDGKRIASADETVQVWDATTGDHDFTYQNHSKSVRSVAWSPDGTRIASGSWDNTVQVWNAP